jgi:DNA polymerase III sliding clamp (beta) subunit (PCNA family)
MQSEIKTSIAQNQVSSENILDLLHSIIYENSATLSPSASPDNATGPGAASCIAAVKIQNFKSEMELMHKFPARSAMPILDTIHVRIGRNQVLFEGNNLESSLSIVINAETHGYCDIAIPWGKHFRQNELDLQVFSDDTVYVNGSKLIYRDAAEFPRFAQLPDRQPDFSISLIDLDNLHAADSFISDDELKPALMGFYLDHKRFAATDGHRLIIKHLQNPVPFSAIVPKYLSNYLSAMKKVIDFDPVPCWLDSEKNWFWMKLNSNIILWIRFIDEQYPDIDSVIPDLQGENYLCEMTGGELKSLIDTLKPAFLNAAKNVHWLRLIPGRIKTYCEVNGKPSDQIFLNPTALKPPFEIQFDYFYFKAIADYYSDTDLIRIYFKSAISAALFIQTDENQNQETILLMPIRIDN